VVHSIPREEMYSSDSRTLKAHIKVALAGYVSERIKYGVTTDGVSSDFSNAMTIAHDMVWRLGMGDNGFVGDFTRIPADQLSDDLKQKLNGMTQKLLQDSMTEVERTLKADWPIVERFAAELQARDELDYDEIAAIFQEYGKPPKSLAASTPVPPAAAPLPAALDVSKPDVG
ncbi:MAG TPA: hypothetical protein VNK24_10525, partial [Elusimicrobiota bacterium]|nr:hypothetical protein [Elusimicrobiota bacterium]